MKNLVTKLFAVIFVIILAAGCASSITAPQDLQAEQEITETEAPAPGGIISSGNMQESVEKPPL